MNQSAQNIGKISLVEQQVVLLFFKILEPYICFLNQEQNQKQNCTFSIQPCQKNLVQVEN